MGVFVGAMCPFKCSGLLTWQGFDRNKEALILSTLYIADLRVTVVLTAGQSSINSARHEACILWREKTMHWMYHKAGTVQTRTLQTDWNSSFSSS